MVKDLTFHAKRDTFFMPEVRLQVEEGKGLIRGESYMEDTFDFYQKIEAWIDEYFDLGKESFDLNLRLQYFNTSSSRALLGIFQKLKSYRDKGKAITINWMYPDPDENELLEEGQDFEADSGIPFNFLKYIDTKY